MIKQKSKKHVNFELKDEEPEEPMIKAEAECEDYPNSKSDKLLMPNSFSFDKKFNMLEFSAFVVR